MGIDNCHISYEKAAPIIAYLFRPENAWKSNAQVAREIGTKKAQVMRAKFKYRLGLTMKIAIKRIRRDAGLQPRAELDAAVVTEYADAMVAGRPFPPPTVYYDGVSYWLADGYHRVAAALQAKAKSLHVEVKQGEKRDAKLFAAGANAEHGLKRSNADKRRAVLSLLNDEEWGAKSNDWIAIKCRVSDQYVGNLRRESGRSTTNVCSAPVRQCSDGRTMDTAKIGKNRKPRSAPATVDEPRPDEAEELAEFVAETNGIYRDAEPEAELSEPCCEASANGYHEPEAVAVATEDKDDDEPPWPFTLGTRHVIALILRYFNRDAREALLRDLAERAGFTLTPVNKG